MILSQGEYMFVVELESLFKKISYFLLLHLHMMTVRIIIISRITIHRAVGERLIFIHIIICNNDTQTHVNPCEWRGLCGCPLLYWWGGLTAVCWGVTAWQGFMKPDLSVVRWFRPPPPSHTLSSARLSLLCLCCLPLSICFSISSLPLAWFSFLFKYIYFIIKLQSHFILRLCLPSFHFGRTHVCCFLKVSPIHECDTSCPT